MPAIPRILIAVLIGYSISVPLELRLFESEVMEQVKEIEKIEMQRYVERLRQERDKVIDSVKSEREALKQEEDELRKENERSQEEIARMEERIKALRHELRVDLGNYESTINEFAGEIDGTSGTKKRGYGQVATLKEELVEDTGGWYKSSRDQTIKRIESMGKRILEINERHNQSAVRLDSQLT